MATLNAGVIGVELYGARSCPYTNEYREHLIWSGIAFVEYDVELDDAARARLLALTRGGVSIPVLMENGHVKEVGWRGRACTIGATG